MNLFNDVENDDLRTWNRCAVAFNILKDKGMTIGQEQVKKYSSNFSLEDRQLMSSMFARIKRDGYEQVRSSINRNIQA
jgi:hypothetical protein